MTRVHHAIAVACVASAVVAGSTASAGPAGGARPPHELPTYLRAEVDDFVVLYHPSLGDRVRHEVDGLPDLRRELEAELGTPVLADVELEVTLGSHESLEDDRRTRVVLLNNQAHDSEVVRERIRFELARRAIREASAGAAPLWFERAFAERFARGVSVSEVVSMLELTLRDGVPPLTALADLDGERCALGCEAETAAATDFVRFLSTREGALARLMSTLRSDEKPDFDHAITDATNMPADGLDKAWHQESSGRHWLIAAVSAFVMGVIAWFLLRLFRRAMKSSPVSRQGVAARRRRKARLLGRPSPTGDEATVIAARVEIPRIEHDGSWHTLH